MILLLVNAFSAKPEDQKTQSHVIFLENFFDEVRRKVQAGK